jgi:heme oxygenase
MRQAMIAAAAAPAAAPDARALLRAATEAAHERAHRLAAFRAIKEGTLDRSAYAALLGRLFRFHSALAAAAAEAGLGAIGTAPSRLALLLSDLAFLEAPAPAPARWRDRPAGRLGMFGALYVAQGSTLGGRIVARRLDYLLGPGEDGRRFLAATPADALGWRRLLGVLEREGRSPAAREAMAAGAVAAFALFERCMAEPV